MRSLFSLAGAVFGVAIVCGTVFAAETAPPPLLSPATLPSNLPSCAPALPPGCLTPCLPGMPNIDPQTGQPLPGAVAPGAADAFAAQSRAGTGDTGSFNPNMFGDQNSTSSTCDHIVAFQNGHTRIPVVVGTQIPNPVAGAFYILASGKTIAFQGTPGVAYQISNTTVGQCFRDLPVNTALGSFKITENESPRPQDRVFGTFNYFNDVNGSSNMPGVAETNIYREVMGFEKTFLDGNASFGLRVPYIQVTGDGSLSRDDFGDISLILKYAFLNDRDTGNVLSGGLVVTVPTGNNFLPNGLDDIHSTVIQPFVGGIYNFSRNCYIQGFSSIAVPTEGDDITFWFNDVGIGYTVWRNDDREARLTSITPILEGHVTTPLNHRGSDADPIGSADIFDMTTGVTFGFHHGSTLNLGVVVPLTGPRPFDIETQLQFNWRF